MIRRSVLAGVALLLVVGAGCVIVPYARVALRPQVVNCPASYNLPDFGGRDYLPSPEVTQAIRRYQYAHWSEYGGEYLSHEAIVEAMTGHLEQHRQAFEKIVGDPRRVKVIQVAHPQWQLDQLAKQVVADRPYLRSRGVQLYGVASDGIYQQVRVLLSDGSGRTRDLMGGPRSGARRDSALWGPQRPFRWRDSAHWGPQRRFRRLGERP